jgi:hypothetical protein
LELVEYAGDLAGWLAIAGRSLARWLAILAIAGLCVGRGVKCEHTAFLALSWAAHSEKKRLRVTREGIEAKRSTWCALGCRWRHLSGAKKFKLNNKYGIRVLRNPDTPIS